MAATNHAHVLRVANLSTAVDHIQLSHEALLSEGLLQCMSSFRRMRRLRRRDQKICALALDRGWARRTVGMHFGIRNGRYGMRFIVG